jgi:hypothetical protein
MHLPAALCTNTFVLILVFFINKLHAPWTTKTSNIFYLLIRICIHLALHCTTLLRYKDLSIYSCDSGSLWSNARTNAADVQLNNDPKQQDQINVSHIYSYKVELHFPTIAKTWLGDSSYDDDFFFFSFWGDFSRETEKRGWDFSKLFLFFPSAAPALKGWQIETE